MKTKFNILALCFFVLSQIVFVFTYFFYHYMSANGNFTPIFQETAAKPFVSLLFGIWGVMFLFASVLSFLIGVIFYSKK